MAKIKTPLLSFDGRGQIGKSIVFANWRGVPYARQLVTPSNPDTAAQQSTRTVFSGMSGQWKISTAVGRTPWNANATGRPYTGRNKFIGDNVAAMRGDTDMANYIGSPGARGGIPAASVAAVGGVGSGEIDVTWTDPSPPTGWTLDNIIVQYFLDRDPSTPMTDVPAEDTIAAAVETDTITGLTPTTQYAISVWTIWTRPDGLLAYGPSETVLATSTT